MPQREGPRSTWVCCWVVTVGTAVLAVVQILPERWALMALADRENTARENLRRGLDREGLANVRIDRLRREADGYRVMLTRGAAKYQRTGIDEAILEDEDSPQLEALIREVRQALQPPGRADGA